MKWLRFFLSVNLCVALTFESSVTFAQAPQRGVAIFERFLQLQALRVNSDLHAFGKSEALAQTSQQLAALTPLEFNQTLFQIIKTYVEKPDVRPSILLLIQSLQQTLQSDLRETQRIREGAWDYVLQSTYTYGLGLYVAANLAQAALTRVRRGRVQLNPREVYTATPTDLTRLSRRSRYQQAALASGSVIGGGAIGWAEDFLRRNNERRADPLAVLNVAQANMACELSYRSLDLGERAETMITQLAGLLGSVDENGKPDDQQVYDQAKKDSDALISELTRFTEAQNQLQQQFQMLTDLDVKSDVFQRLLRWLPEGQSWGKYRELLSDTEELSQNGRCRAISFLSIERGLSKLAIDLQLMRVQLKMVALVDSTAPESGPISYER